ncbi:uncharacterized protein [Delphinus delphis]|uniref:uncharacterized protein isoform X2 n=1 Tax=Delphinus delphis TaxID=9728 RepID=UPI0028C422CB|nr:uncharacterized protein LOC132438386 isoform X1 [Delphinus delphis]
MHHLKVESTFYSVDKTEDLSPGHSTSDNSGTVPKSLLTAGTQVAKTWTKRTSWVAQSRNGERTESQRAALINVCPIGSHSSCFLVSLWPLPTESGPRLPQGGSRHSEEQRNQLTFRMNFLKLSAEPRDLLQRLRPPLALGPSYPPALSCLSPALPPSALDGPWSPESSVFLQLPLCLSDSPWAASRGHPGRPAPSPADGLPQGKEQLLARRPFPGVRVSGRSTAVASLSRRVSPDQHLPRVPRHEAPSVHWSPTRLHGQRHPLHVSKLKALGVLIPDPRASNTHSDPCPGALPCSPQPGVEARSGPALAQGRAGSR